jgi:hypothetical protein
MLSQYDGNFPISVIDRFRSRSRSHSDMVPFINPGTKVL